MAVKGVWFGNKQWPSGRSPGDFAKDVFRIEKCKTDKEKAFAFYTWLQRCMMRGPNIYTASASGAYSRCFDPLTIFTWGSHECTGWGWVAAEALNAAGLKARRMVANNNGHTFYEVYYKGDNGKEAWHAFDPYIGWYFLNKEGEVASTEELGKDHNLVHDPYPGHALPCCHDWIRGILSRRSDVSDWVDVVQELKGEQLSYNLDRGQAISALWQPADGEKALVTYDDAPPGERGKSYIRGSHCSITPYDHEGRIRFPDHEPYWRNYRWGSSLNPHESVRWHGCGNLRWTPLLYGEDAVLEAHNAVFENNTVRVKGNNTYAEIWYRIRLPYLIHHLYADWSVKGAGEAGLSISADGGNTLWDLKRGGAPCGGLVQNGKADYLAGRASVQGLREFLLRIDLLAYDRGEELRVDALRIQVGFHHNMHIQPRLLPGENELYIEADEVDSGDSLEVRWAATAGDREITERLALDTTGRTERKIDVGCEKPEDIIMRGVTLEVICEPNQVR